MPQRIAILTQPVGVVKNCFKKADKKKSRTAGSGVIIFAKLGRKESNLRVQESKSCALPLGDYPRAGQGGYWDSNPGYPEPQSGALTNWTIPTICLIVPETTLPASVPAGIRTQDTRLRRPLLYPTELQAHGTHLMFGFRLNGSRGDRT